MNNFTILLTDNAVTHLKKVIKDGYALHIGLKTSGCNGYGYTMDINPTNQEYEIKVKGIAIVVYPENRDKMNFSTVDYKKEGLNSKLVIDNPQVRHQCGCGESISF